MAELSYNRQIFTSVSKWDANFTYTGIQINDKLNQRNGQNYKLLDAIDIDWNGMWVAFANAYIYNTEELLSILTYIDQTDRFTKINKRVAEIEENYVDYNTLLNMVSQLQSIFSGGDHIAISDDGIISTYGLVSLDYIAENYTTYSYLYEYSYSKEGTLTAIDDKLNLLIGNADESFNTIKEISDWIMRQSEYVEVEYISINFDSGNRYYRKDGDKYIEVDQQYVITHPNEQYYTLHNIETAMVDLSDRLAYVEQTIGYAKLIDGSYSYSGIMNDLHNLYESDKQLITTLIELQRNVTTIQYDLINVTATANEAKETANEALLNANEAITQSELALNSANNALEQIGDPLVPAHYEQITKEEAAEMQANGQNIYIRHTDGSYTSEIYSTSVDYTWYAYVDNILPTGIRKEIYDLSQLTANPLGNLYVNNEDSISYVYLSIGQDGNESTIYMHSKKASILFDNGIIEEDGLTTATSVNQMMSYMVEWIDVSPGI